MVYSLKSIVPAVIILSIFLFALIPVNDFDFWWHLKTGEYILEHKKLPDTDPFSYTAVSTDRDSPGRPQFILKSYWLGQAIFAVIVKVFGLKGFIVMRAAVFALIALIALKIQSLQSIVYSPKSAVSELRTPNSEPLSAIRYSLLLLLALITTECLTDRPQMFSFLFAILVVYIIEVVRICGLRPIAYGLPLIMLLWAQIHAGYIVGIAYLLVYLITIPFEEILKRRSKILIPLIALSVLITYLNPCHWQGMGAAFYAHGGSVLFKETLEFLSPVTIFPFVKKNPGWLSYWGLIGLSLIAIIPLIKRRLWTRLLMLTGTALASLISMRYTYFFAPVAVAIIPSIFNGRGKFIIANLKFKMLTDNFKVMSVSIILILILAFTLTFTYHRVNFKGLLKSEIAGGYFPGQAADYILSRGIPQPIFNDVNWGGYLTYRLWPEYKVFVDTRALNIDIYRQYMSVLNYTREGEDILQVYRIKSIITPAINPYTGEIFPLVRGLMKDDNWALIYLDGVATIFVKKGYANQSLPKTAIYQQVFYELMFWSPSFPNVPGYRKTMDEVEGALEGVRP